MSVRGTRKLEIDEYEQGILINALNLLRNQQIRERRPTDPVDELIMKMIEHGGYLVTCSCSQHVLPEMFRSMVLDAAHDAHVYLRQAEFRTQGKDHPILPYARETEYLKCGIYQVFT